MVISPEFHKLTQLPHFPENQTLNVHVDAGKVQVALALRVFGAQVEDTLPESKKGNVVMGLWINTLLADKFRIYIESHSDTSIDTSDPVALDALLAEVRKIPLVGEDSTIH